MKDTAKTIYAVIAGIIGLALVTVLGIYIFGGINLFTAGFRGKVDENNKVNSGDYRISSYNKFFDDCGAIQADEDRIGNLKKEYKTADSDRKVQLDTTITAVENSRAEKIRSYNADARKEATEGQFLSSNLPYQIDINGETTCTR